MTADVRASPRILRTKYGHSVAMFLVVALVSAFWGFCATSQEKHDQFVFKDQIPEIWEGNPRAYSLENYTRELLRDIRSAPFGGRAIYSDLSDGLTSFEKERDRLIDLRQRYIHHWKEVRALEQELTEPSFLEFASEAAAQENAPTGLGWRGPFPDPAGDSWVYARDLDELRRAVSGYRAALMDAELLAYREAHAYMSRALRQHRQRGKPSEFDILMMHKLVAALNCNMLDENFVQNGESFKGDTWAPIESSRFYSDTIREPDVGIYWRGSWNRYLSGFEKSAVFHNLPKTDPDLADQMQDAVGEQYVHRGARLAYFSQLLRRASDELYEMGRGGLDDHPEIIAKKQTIAQLELARIEAETVYFDEFLAYMARDGSGLTKKDLFQAFKRAHSWNCSFYVEQERRRAAQGPKTAHQLFPVEVTFWYTEDGRRAEAEAKCTGGSLVARTDCIAVAMEQTTAEAPERAPATATLTVTLTPFFLLGPNNVRFRVRTSGPEVAGELSPQAQNEVWSDVTAIKKAYRAWLHPLELEEVQTLYSRGVMFLRPPMGVEGLSRLAQTTTAPRLIITKPDEPL